MDEAALPLRTFLMAHVMPTLTEVQAMQRHTPTHANILSHQPATHHYTASLTHRRTGADGSLQGATRGPDRLFGRIPLPAQPSDRLRMGEGRKKTGRTRVAAQSCCSGLPLALQTVLHHVEHEARGGGQVPVQVSHSAEFPPPLHPPHGHSRTPSSTACWWYTILQGKWGRGIRQPRPCSERQRRPFLLSSRAEKRKPRKGTRKGAAEATKTKRAENSGWPKSPTKD